MGLTKLVHPVKESDAVADAQRQRGLLFRFRFRQRIRLRIRNRSMSAPIEGFVARDGLLLQSKPSAEGGKMTALQGIFLT